MLPLSVTWQFAPRFLAQRGQYTEVRDAAITPCASYLEPQPSADKTSHREAFFSNNGHTVCVHGCGIKKHTPRRELWHRLPTFTKWIHRSKVVQAYVQNVGLRRSHHEPLFVRTLVRSCYCRATSRSTSIACSSTRTRTRTRTGTGTRGAGVVGTHGDFVQRRACDKQAALPTETLEASPPVMASTAPCSVYRVRTYLDSASCSEGTYNNSSR